MPYVDGESLRDRLTREKQLSLEDALQITKEVANALGYAHSLGLVHRDIKPENILFTAGHAVVSDFGLARAVTEAGGEKLTETGIAVGTPAYMSPEQGAGSGELDARSDIYSLGCVLYEMLSGDAPYTASTPQALIAKKLSEPTPRISVVRETVPASVEVALTKALARMPADRFARAQQFVEALAAPNGAIRPLARAGERAGKRHAWRWVAGLAAVVAVVAVGLVLLDGRRSRIDSAADEDAIERLVVAPLENRTGDTIAADWGFMAAEYVTRALDRASVVTVVPASAVRDLVRDVDPAVVVSLAEIVRRTRARYAVVGSYGLSGDRVRFDVELVNAESGELERSLDPVSGPVDSLAAVFTLLAERVTAATMARLSLDLGPGFSSRLYSSPPTLDAVRGMLEMQEVFCRSRYREAIDVAQSVLEETPNYGPVLVLSSIALGNLGRLREADSVLTLIEPIRGQLTSAERHLAEWYHGSLHGDHAEETRAAEQLYLIGPGQYGYHAGLTAMHTNRFADALERFLANDKDVGCYRYWAALWRMTASAYHMLGRYQEALDVAWEGFQRFPGDRPLIYYEQIALAGLGQLDAVDSLLDYVADLPPQPRSRNIYNPGSQAAMVALELSVLGRPEASDRVMDRALAWFAAWPASELRFERGQVLYWAERWSDADTLFAALMADAPNNLQHRGYRGVALAHLGRRDEAMEIDRWLEGLDRPFLRGTHTRWRAAIAAALGDRAGAVRSLQRAYDEGMELGHNFRRDPEWRPLLDYRPYQEFVRAR